MYIILYVPKIFNSETYYYTSLSFKFIFTLSIFFTSLRQMLLIWPHCRAFWLFDFLQMFSCYFFLKSLDFNLLDKSHHHYFLNSSLFHIHFSAVENVVVPVKV
jgi:hypothetical protein